MCLDMQLSQLHLVSYLCKYLELKIIYVFLWGMIYFTFCNLFYYLEFKIVCVFFIGDDFPTDAKSQINRYLHGKCSDECLPYFHQFKPLQLGLTMLQL